MYWLDNIDKYLEHYASPAIQQRGRTLFNIGAVRNIDYNTDENRGVATISGGEKCEVTIINGVTQDFRNIETSCSTQSDKGVTKYEVAALLALKKKFEYDSASILKIINLSESVHKSSEPFLLTKDILEKYEHDAQYASRIRSDKEMVVKYDEIKENYLKISIGELEHSWNKEKYEYETVEVNYDEEGAKVVCTCDQNVIEMCNHQLKVLYNFIIELKQKSLLEKFPELTDIQERAMSLYGLSKVEDVKNFFTLTMGEDGLEYTPNDKEMVSYTDHLYLVKKIKGISEGSMYDIISANSKTDGNLQGIALFLEDTEDVIPVRLHIISGKSNKNNERIVSNVQPVDEPASIHPDLRGIYLEYEKIKSLYNNQFPENNHPVLLNFFKNNFEALKHIPLYAMKEKFSFRKADLRNQDFAEETATIIVKAKKTDKQFIIEAFLKFGEDLISIKDYYAEHNIIFYKHKDKLYLSDSIKTSKAFKVLKERPVFKYSNKAEKSFYDQIAALSGIVNVELDKSIKHKEHNLELLSKAIQLSEKADFLVLQPVVRYDNGQEYYPTLSLGKYESDDESITKINRSHEEEEEYLELLANHQKEWRLQKRNGFFIKPIDQIINTSWIFDLYSFCKEHNISIHGYENLEQLNYNPNEAKVNINLSTGIDWFEGELTIEFGDQVAELNAIKKAILNNEKTVELKDGTLGMLSEEWIEKLSALFRNSDVKDDKLIISKMKFNLIDSLFDEINDEQLKLEIDYRKRRLLDFDKIEENTIPSSIEATLRPYQEQGFYWLKFLDDFGFGGCLADDMGLGKTLQIITFLAYKKETNKEQRTSLVIVPKSLLFNWSDELNKFFPDCKYVIYHGNKRKTLIKKFSQYDIIISTYGTVTNDIEDLMEYHFQYCVLDESQAIKNPQSKRYKAMRLIKADNKLVMTGTPIENQTFDLYAQFNFINPGFFGSAGHFKVCYAEPIDVYGNEAASTELRKMVKPFLLRRTKEQVAQDLPPKTESIIYCEMHPKQRAVYDAFLNKYKNYISQKISENGVQKSKMFVIEALLKLRQICNSPALLNEEEQYENNSAKIDILMEQLSGIIQSHKVLVISQFTSMLSLIKERIEGAQIPYSYLDGNTRNRKEVVDEFQENDEKRIFLLSLKAGGVGLNLATADYVYIVDPWWNPAAEAQAIDRAHRIGQQNHVFAYRMICKDSIEEKIQLLQQRKKKMANDIVQVEESFMKSLAQDDIMALFS